MVDWGWGSTMDAMSTVRHPRTRWLLPVATLAAVVSVPMLVSRAQADPPTLPPRTAQQLITDVLTAKPVALSGEVTQKTDLGLPVLPNLGGGHPGASGPLDPMSLLTGDHTWRVWSDGKGSDRVSLVEGSSELSLISTPKTVWLWDSQANTAWRGTPEKSGNRTKPSTKPSQMPTNPADLAKQLLADIEPTTTLSVDGTATVAGQDAYQLVLTPKQGDSLVQQVRIAVDAVTKLPLSVDVMSTKLKSPAVHVGFSSLTYAQPAASVLNFTPPQGAKVADLKDYVTDPTKADPTTKPTKDGKPSKDEPKVAITGKGWSQVRVITLAEPLDEQATKALAILPQVKGSWGTGRVLSGTLFSVVITDDGRIAAGAVAPAALYAAL